MRSLVRRIERLEDQMATLAEEIARLQPDDTELQADVVAVQGVLTANAAAIAALQAQIAAGGLSPDQEAALTQIANDLEAAHATLTAAITPPVPA